MKSIGGENVNGASAKSRAALALVAGLIVTAFLYSPPIGAQQVTPSQVSVELRTPPPLTYVMQLPDQGANANDTTPGVAGVAAVVTIVGTDGGVTFTDGGFLDSGVAVDGGVTFTDGGAGNAPTISSIAPLPHPCKLEVLMKDGSSATAAALSCSKVTINGRSQFGAARSEVVAASETARNTRHVYEAVTSVQPEGCANGNDSGDVIRIACSSVVGLPFDIEHLTNPSDAVINMCLLDQSAANESFCYAATRFTAGIAGTLDTDDSAIDCSAISTSPSFTLAAGDICQIRTRYQSR